MKNLLDEDLFWIGLGVIFLVTIPAPKNFIWLGVVLALAVLRRY